MILPTGQDENNYMIYELDGRTLRVYFEMVDGLMVNSDEMGPLYFIPGEYPPVSTCFTADVRHSKSTGTSKSVTRLAESKKSRHMRELSQLACPQSAS